MHNLRICTQHEKAQIRRNEKPKQRQSKSNKIADIMRVIQQNLNSLLHTITSE